MQHSRLLPRVVITGSTVLVMIFFSTVAKAGDPDGPMGSKHHSSGSQWTLEPVNVTDQGLEPQDRFHVSLAGDPDNPTGHGTKNSGDPDAPMEKKNGTRLDAAIFFMRFQAGIWAVTRSLFVLR
jgi:hypothetical protein